MFERLTKYIEEIDEKNFGDIVYENCGSIEEPIYASYFEYSDAVRELRREVFRFCDEHPEFDHRNYSRTLEKCVPEWNVKQIEETDVSNLDAKCIIALLVAGSRGEMFCTGLLRRILEAGALHRWLRRLKELDD